VTVERLVKQLHSIGISISKRQIMRLLIAGQDGFLDEARDVLRAGLETAAWITVDDTGARHKRINGVCTQIGNDHFAWFGTTNSKSRRNFLELLRASHPDYVINEAALSYMRERALAGPVMSRLSEQPQRQFADQAAWQAHLQTARHRPADGHARSGADRHRRRAVGQHPGAWVSAQHSDRQRRCRTIRRWPARLVLGARRAAGA
jgi:hypothetical protein